MHKDTVAVVFLDHQDNLVDLCKTTPPNRVRQVAGVVASIAKTFSMPAFASVVPFGVDNPTPIQSIRESLPNIPLIARDGASAMKHAASAEAIRGMGRTSLVVLGVFSEVVVHQTVMDMLGAGYSVTVLADGCAGFEARSEQASFDTMRQRGAGIISAPTFASSLVRTWGDLEGQAAGNALASLLTRSG
jgi:voltage-gated potassium channel Kch